MIIVVCGMLEVMFASGLLYSNQLFSLGICQKRSLGSVSSRLEDQDTHILDPKPLSDKRYPRIKYLYSALGCSQQFNKGHDCRPEMYGPKLTSTPCAAWFGLSGKDGSGQEFKGVECELSSL